MLVLKEAVLTVMLGQVLRNAFTFVVLQGTAVNGKGDFFAIRRGTANTHAVAVFQDLPNVNFGAFAKATVVVIAGNESVSGNWSGFPGSLSALVVVVAGGIGGTVRRGF